VNARDIRNAAAAVLLTLAAATAGTACGSGGEAPGDRGRAPADDGSANPSTDAENSPAGTAAPETPGNRPQRSGNDERDGATDGPPTVPKTDLSPATGDFTKKQKEYLVDRVPRGTDPAAVLQAGQAVCERLTRTAEIDREAAISALESGEIAGAADAVTHLCPKHQPLLEAAGLTGR
jgi:hypothetical protein